jgi:hypothetical protein
MPTYSICPTDNSVGSGAKRYLEGQGSIYDPHLFADTRCTQPILDLGRESTIDPSLSRGRAV